MNPFNDILHYSDWDDETKNEVMLYGIRIGWVAFLVIYTIVYFSSMNKASSTNILTKNIAIYFVGLLLPLMLFVLVILLQLQDKRYLGFIILGILITLFIFLQTLLPSFNAFILSAFNYFISYVNISPLSSESSFLVTIVSKIILAAIFVIGFTILYNVFLNESYKQKRWNGFFLYLLFYIPCLLSDYIKYLFEEFKMTPRVVYVLLLLEIIFILFYIYLPKLFSKIVLTNGTTLINEPRFIYGKSVISNNQPFRGNTNEMKSNIFQISTDASQNQIVLKNYAISMWVTVNSPIVDNKNETMIFRYGEDNNDHSLGCPYIAYTSNDIWKMIVSNQTSYETIHFDEFKKYYIGWIVDVLSYQEDYSTNVDKWYYTKPYRIGKNDEVVESYSDTFLTNDEITFLVDLTLENDSKNTNDVFLSICNKIDNMYRRKYNIFLAKGTNFFKPIYLEYIESYLNNTPATENKLKLFLSQKKDLHPEEITAFIHLPSQRWNNIVFNYHDSTVDIFVNGILTRTIPLGNRLPIYRPTDVVTIGNDKKNVHGAVCNVVVFPKPLTVNQIVRTFNILELKNPPVF